MPASLSLQGGTWDQVPLMMDAFDILAGPTTKV